MKPKHVNFCSNPECGKSTRDAKYANTTEYPVGMIQRRFELDGLEINGDKCKIDTYICSHCGSSFLDVISKE